MSGPARSDSWGTADLGIAAGPRSESPPTRAFIVAHRGASAQAPENTLVAFERALQAGATVLECDVQVSRDGQVVVIHDAALERTTNGHGLVSEWRWDDLRRLDAGYPARFGDRFAGTRIPCLAEVLERVRGRGKLQVEIKPESVGPRHGGIEECCLELIARCGMNDSVTVISRSRRALRRVRAQQPAIAIGLVFRSARRRHLAAQAVEAGVDWLIASADVLSNRPDTVRRARRAGMRVGAFVVNSTGLLETLVRAGVESIASDRPGAMLAGLRQWTDGRRA